MEHQTVWEHKVQVLGDARAPDDWPTFDALWRAHDFVKRMKESGFVCIAIYSRPVLVLNAPGGDC